MYLTSPFSEQPYGTLTAAVIILYGFSSVHPHSHNSQQKTGSVQYWTVAHDGPVAALDASRLAQRLNQSRGAERQDGGRK